MQRPLIAGVFADANPPTGGFVVLGRLFLNLAWTGALNECRLRWQAGANRPVDVIFSMAARDLSSRWQVPWSGAEMVSPNFKPPPVRSARFAGQRAGLSWCCLRLSVLLPADV
jgi:hypothetical protein